MKTLTPESAYQYCLQRGVEIDRAARGYTRRFLGRDDCKVFELVLMDHYSASYGVAGSILDSDKPPAFKGALLLLRRWNGEDAVWELYLRLCRSYDANASPAEAGIHLFDETEFQDLLIFLGLFMTTGCSLLLVPDHGEYFCEFCDERFLTLAVVDQATADRRFGPIIEVFEMKTLDAAQAEGYCRGSGPG